MQLGKFLSQVASQVHAANHSDLSEVALVFPTRRAALYFKNELAKCIDRPIFFPKTYTLDTFLEQVTSIKKVDRAVLLAEFYDVYRELMPEPIESYDSFCSWGGKLITDYEDIDGQMLNSQQFFRYFLNISEIEVWTPGLIRTELQNNYLEFLTNMEVLYQGFLSRLLEKKIGYQGLILHKMVQDELVIPFEHTYFVGFGGISKAQRKLFELLHNSKRATICWDVDSYYYHNSNQEAYALFHEKDKSELPNIDFWVKDTLSINPKKITLIEGAGLHTLTSALTNLLQKLENKKFDLNSTAIVLADESHLLPVLQAIPKSISNVNVTMGYPLKFAAVSDLIVSWIIMFLKSTSGNTYYYKHVFNIIDNRLIRNNVISTKSINVFKNKIIRENRVSLSCSEILNNFPELELIFSGNDSPQHLLNSIIYFLENLPFNHKEDAYTLSPVFTDAMIKQLKLIANTNHKYQFLNTTASLLNAVRDSIENTKVSLQGEPLGGLQVMGLLETRLLDFDNVIVFGANESVLPSVSKNPGFIPLSVKNAFGLTSYEKNEAINAYNFYRLLHYPSHVWMLYSSETSNMKGAEPSRYIRQIEHELVALNSSVTIEKEKWENSIELLDDEVEINIEKDENVLANIKNYIERSKFSPSRFIDYFNCSLKFYLETIVGFYEDEEISDTFDSRITGNLIHKALENVFKPYLNTILNENLLKKIISEVDLELAKAKDEILQYSDISSGKNLLVYRVSGKIIKKYLKNILDKKDFFAPIGFEKQFEFLDFHTIGESKINLKGTADRIDSVGQLIRIIDYKTGKVEDKDFKLKTIDEVFEKRNRYLFQLLWYSLLTRNEYGKGVAVNAGVVPLGQLNSPDMFITTQENTPFVPNEYLDEFEVKLKVAFEELLDPNIKIKQSKDPQGVCRFCQFNKMCEVVV